MFCKIEVQRRKIWGKRLLVINEGHSSHHLLVVGVKGLLDQRKLLSTEPPVGGDQLGELDQHRTHIHTHTHTQNHRHTQTCVHTNIYTINIQQ